MNKSLMGVVGVFAVVGLVALGWWYVNQGNVSNGQSGGKVVIETNPTGVMLKDETASGEARAENGQEGQMRTITVVGDKFRFNPAEIRMKKGETVKIVFKSADMLHDFVIDEFELATSQIGAGEEEELEFTADKAGTFEYYCSVGKHRANGMVGKLIVE